MMGNFTSQLCSSTITDFKDKSKISKEVNSHKVKPADKTFQNFSINDTILQENGNKDPAMPEKATNRVVIDPELKKLRDYNSKD
jgi:hypothetical protein